MHKADKWLVEQISKGLLEKFGVSNEQSIEYLKQTNFFLLLESMPEQVHHDSPQQWIKYIAERMKLEEVVKQDG